MEEAPALKGPVRVLGAAGSGKTAHLAALHGRLVRDGVDPNRILVVVRSAAAREAMERRLARGRPAAHPRPMVCTPAECGALVQTALAGGGPEPQRLTAFGGWLAARVAIEQAQAQLPRLAPLRADPACIEDVRRAVAAFSQAMVGPGLLAERLAGATPALQELAVLAARSEDVRRRAAVTDLDGIVADAVAGLLARPEALADRFDAILVDDAHEWDAAEFHLVCALHRRLPPPRRLAVTGDPRQAIGGAFGKSPRWLVEELPLAIGVSDVVLEGSFRCPAPILAAAAALEPGAGPLIAVGDERTGSQPPAGQHPIEIWRAADESAEALGVVRAIKAWVLAGAGRYRDVAVLVRRLDGLGPVLAEAFAAIGVPSHLGRIGWSEHPGLASLRTWLRWGADPHDPQQFAACLATPWGGLTAPTRRWLERRSGTHGFDLRRTAVVAAGSPAGSGDGGHLAAVRQLLDRTARAEAGADSLRRGPVDPQALAIWVGRLAVALGLFDAAGEDPTLAAALRGVHAALAAILDVEARLRGRPPTLATTLDLLDVALQRATEEDDGNPDRDAVHLLTIEEARGLGFPRVFVVGCAAGRLPYAARPLGLLAPDELTSLLERVPELQDTLSEPDRQLEEEARFLAVALTRAASAVTCTYALRYGGRPAEASILLAPLRAAGVPERPLPAFSDVTRSDLVCELVAARTPGPTLADAGADVAREAARLAAALEPFDPVAGPAAPVTRPVELAATAVGEWLACPRRLFYQLVLHPEAPDVGRLRGQAAHRLLELVHRDEAEGAGDPDAFRRTARRQLEGEVLPWLATEVPGRLLHRAVAAWLERLVDRYARHAVAAAGGAEGTLGVERSFCLALDGIVIRGRIDRIRHAASGALEVVDYKTGGLPARTVLLPAIRGSEAEGPSDWQLPIYGLAVSRGAVVPIPAAVPQLIRSWYVGVDPPSVRDPDRPIPRRGLLVDGADVSELTRAESEELGSYAADELAQLADRLVVEGRRIAAGRFPAAPRHRTRTCLDPDRGCFRSGCCVGAGSVGRGHPVPRP